MRILCAVFGMFSWVCLLSFTRRLGSSVTLQGDRAAKPSILKQLNMFLWPLLTWKYAHADGCALSLPDLGNQLVAIDLFPSAPLLKTCTTHGICVSVSTIMVPEVSLSNKIMFTYQVTFGHATLSVRSSLRLLCANTNDKSSTRELACMRNWSACAQGSTVPGHMHWQWPRDRFYLQVLARHPCELSFNSTPCRRKLRTISVSHTAIARPRTGYRETVCCHSL